MNDLLYSIGLDITDLKTSARATKEQAEDMKRGFKGFKDVLEFGGVTFAVTSFFAKAIEGAKKATGELDAQEAALLRLGASAETAKSVFEAAAVKLGGWVVQLGEGIGQIAGGLLYGKEAVKDSMKLAQVEAERIRDQAREVETKKQIEEVEKKITETAVKRKELSNQDLSLQEQMVISIDRVVKAQQQLANHSGDELGRKKLLLKLQEEQLGYDKISVEISKQFAEEKKQADDQASKAADEYIKLQDQKLKLQYESLSTDEKIAKLAGEEMQITKSIARMKKEGAETIAAEVALLETQADLGRLRKQQAEDQAKAEKMVTKEIEDQTQAFVDQSQIRRTLSQTTATKDYTDRQLAEKINNLRQQIAEDQNNLQGFGGPSGFANPFTVLMSEDLRKAEAEQNYRQRFRTLYSQEGEKAFQRFSAFDEERLRNYVRPEDEKRAQRQLEVLEEIQSRLAYLPR